MIGTRPGGCAPISNVLGYPNFDAAEKIDFSEGRFCSPLAEMNATDRTRRKMHAGNNDSDGEIAKLTRTYDWRTTDQDEIRLRQQRAKAEQPQISNLDPAQRIFSQFEVVSRSGMTYNVELRSVAERIFSCTCTDFRINGLGTCKHVEGVLLHLEARFPKLFAQAVQNGSDRIDVVWDETLNSLRVEKAHPKYRQH